MSDTTNLLAVQAEDDADIQAVQKPYVRLEAGRHSPVNVDLANSFWDETKLKQAAILRMLARRALKDDIKHSKYLGHYVDLDSLIAAIPEPTPGDYADVDAGDGSPVVRYIWDATDQKWEAQVGESTQLTGEQIKEMYESEDNTNAFTDAEKEKLGDLGNYGGTYDSYEDLVAGTDVGKVTDGSYAIVDPGVGGDVIQYIWDATDQKWVRNTLDGETIKILYEAEDDTNAFTDRHKEIVEGIEDGTMEVPTAETNDYSQIIANTKFVVNRIANIPSVPTSTPYTVVGGDKGKSIDTSANVTIPPNVFAVGDTLVVTNTTAGEIRVIPGAGVTIRHAGTEDIGIVILDSYGVTTLRMVTNNNWRAIGMGMSI